MSRRRIGYGILAVVVIVAVGTAGLLRVFAAEGAPAPKAAGTVKVQRGTVTTTVSASGTVVALASRKLAFTVTATVTELAVKAGDVVTPGTVLARVDDAAARTGVDTARSNVNSAQDAVTKAQAPTPTATGCAQPAALPQPSRSPSAGPRPSASSPRACATQTTPKNQNTRDNLLAAQQQLNNAKLALRQAETRLAGTVLTAPLAGKVLSVAGVLGSTATAGGTFIVLAGTGDVAVTAQFTEAEVAALAVGQQARVTLPDRRGTTFTGSLAEVDLAGTTTNRLVRYGARIAFDQVPDGLLYGQSATVAVITAAAADVLYVPSTAVADLADGRGTVVVRAGGRSERRQVEVGLQGDATVEIRAGLAAGEEVLTSGR